MRIDRHIGRRYQIEDRLLETEVSQHKDGSVVLFGRSEVLRTKIGVPDGDERIRVVVTPRKSEPCKNC